MTQRVQLPLLAAALATAVLLPAVRAAAADATAITISHSQKTVDFLPLWIASDAGYFKEHGINPTVNYLPAQEGMPALLSGQVQIAGNGASDAASAEAQGAKLKVVLTLTPIYTFQFWARADHASGAEEAKLCVEYAQAELEYANDWFTKGDVDQAQSAISSVMEYVRKGTDAAKSSGKRLKQTEIELRKLQKRMKDIAESLNLDDRPPVLKSVDEIEQLRAGLLAAMFGAQAEPRGKS